MEQDGGNYAGSGSNAQVKPAVNPAVELNDGGGQAIDLCLIVSPAKEIVATPDRSTLYAAQTPQIFRYARLRQAHAQFSGDATDDAAMVESLGDRVVVFPGSYRNLKVTTPEDLAAVAGWVGML